MMDPMANLDGGSAPGASKDDVDSKDAFDPMVLRLNLNRIDQVRSYMGIVSGCVAGIGGLTGLEGLACFILLHVFVALCIWASKMNFNLKAYTRQSWMGYLTTNIQQCGLSFMLFWTLFYGLVYLF
mmetsp:Transcript_3856/g.5571  ORF Transcript_3856/g.5571 Transcript_3856/m.5571 type:complete len:126 (+) Transcript_3856:203-580(+)